MKGAFVLLQLTRPSALHLEPTSPFRPPPAVPQTHQPLSCYCEAHLLAVPSVSASLSPDLRCSHTTFSRRPGLSSLGDSPTAPPPATLRAPDPALSSSPFPPARALLLRVGGLQTTISRTPGSSSEMQKLEFSLTMAQWRQIRLESTRTQVRPLASLSGLRIRHCQELWCRSQMRLGSGVAVAVVQAGGGNSSNWTPSLGTSTCCGRGPQETNRKKKCKISGLAPDPLNPNLHFSQDAPGDLWAQERDAVGACYPLLADCLSPPPRGC